MSRRTIQRWQKIEAFQRVVSDRRATRKAGERVKEAKAAAIRGFNLEEAMSDLRQSQRDTRLAARTMGTEVLGKCAARIQSLVSDEISVKDLPALLRTASDLLKWATDSQAEELELDQLIELKLGPKSLLAQKVEIEADAAIGRIFQAIALSQEIPAEYKQTFYRLIGGLDGSD